MTKKENNDGKLVCDNCIECCANVPVGHKELVRIRRALRAMPADLVERLRNQHREPGTCPFADVEAKRCTIYEHRPWVCDRFGFVERMQCSYNKHIELQPFGESMVEWLEQYSPNGKDAEMDVEYLGITLTWEKGLLRQ